VYTSSNKGLSWSNFSKGLYAESQKVYASNGQLYLANQRGWFYCPNLICDGQPTTDSGVVGAQILTSSVVEFYHDQLKHYFYTSDSAEIKSILNGDSGQGWTKTGHSFKAWLPKVNPVAKPVCRFYGDPIVGPNSHFFSVNSDECEKLDLQSQVSSANVKKWNFEGLGFTVEEANTETKTCNQGRKPVYRAYNNGFLRGIDSNHRFFTDAMLIATMVSNQWTLEGVVFCAEE
jgi:hypothetical protein